MQIEGFYEEPFVDQLPVGDLGEPVTTFIEKVFEAIGGALAPYQMRRIARAEADVARIKLESEIELTKIKEAATLPDGFQARALLRGITAETERQKNIESITAKAAGHLKSDASPQDMDSDWIRFFFDSCKDISSEEMQGVWAKIIAGETNKRGSFSRQAIAVMRLISKPEADLFTSVCSTCWDLGAMRTTVIDLAKEGIHKSFGITFENIQVLESYGLLRINSLEMKFTYRDQPPWEVSYFGRRYSLRPRKGVSFYEPNTVPMGAVYLTKPGVELSRICGAKPNEAILTQTLKYWEKAVDISPVAPESTPGKPASPTSPQPASFPQPPA